MKNERTVFTTEALIERKESLLRIAEAVQELIDNPERSMTECFRAHNLHYFNTRFLLTSLGRCDLSEKMIPVDFQTEAGRYDTYALPEEELYMKVFFYNKDDRQRIKFPDDYKEAIAYVFKHKLTPNETRIIKARCGYFGVKETLEEIGTELGLTRERVRQIEQNACRKLRHPSVAYILQCGLKAYQEKEQAKEEERKSQEEQLNYRLTEPWENIEGLPEEELIHTFLFIHKTSEIGLSKRSANCLLRENIDLLFDIFALSEQEMSEIRSLGGVCKAEIYKTMASFAEIHGTTREELSSFCRDLVEKYDLSIRNPLGRGFQLQNIIEKQFLGQFRYSI